MCVCGVGWGGGGGGGFTHLSQERGLVCEVQHFCVLAQILNNLHPHKVTVPIPPRVIEWGRERAGIRERERGEGRAERGGEGANERGERQRCSAPRERGRDCLHTLRRRGDSYVRCSTFASSHRSWTTSIRTKLLSQLRRESSNREKISQRAPAGISKTAVSCTHHMCLVFFRNTYRRVCVCMCARVCACPWECPCVCVGV